MKGTRLPLNCDHNLPVTEGEKNILDKGMISPHSRGEFNAGEGSRGNKPKYKLEIIPKNQSGISLETNFLGSEEHFVTQVVVGNNTGLPIFVTVRSV